jgi:hypothetical protein
MKLLLSLLISAGPTMAMDFELPEADISATSKIGSRILSKARMLEGDNDQAYTSWVAGYSIKFDKCVSSANYYGGYFAENGDNADANYYYNGAADANEYNYNQDAEQQDAEQQDAEQQDAEQQDAEQQNAQAYNYNGNRRLEQNQGYYGNEADAERQDYNGMYEQRLVHFKLCPTGSCFSCKNGADYVVELNEFIDAVLEAKLAANEYNCARVRDNCYCENAYSKQSCLNACYTNAKMDYCSENNQQENNVFDLQEALECAELNVDEQAMENYYYKNRQQGQYYNEENMKYYVGPYCSANGKKILMGLFQEETCSYPAPSGTFEALNYGQALPYSKKSLIDNSCISCMEPKEEKNYWDEQDADEVTDVCERLYEDSGKCEEGLQLGYGVQRNNMACEFIASVKSSYLPTAVPAKVFAGIFAVTTVALAALSLVLFKKSKRNDVSLNAAAHPLE